MNAFSWPIATAFRPIGGVSPPLSVVAESAEKVGLRRERRPASGRGLTTKTSGFRRQYVTPKPTSNDAPAIHGNAEGRAAAAGRNPASPRICRTCVTTASSGSPETSATSRTVTPSSSKRCALIRPPSRFKFPT